MQVMKSVRPAVKRKRILQWAIFVVVLAGVDAVCYWEWGGERSKLRQTIVKEQREWRKIVQQRGDDQGRYNLYREMKYRSLYLSMHEKDGSERNEAKGVNYTNLFYEETLGEKGAHWRNSCDPAQYHSLIKPGESFSSKVNSGEILRVHFTFWLDRLHYGLDTTEEGLAPIVVALLARKDAFLLLAINDPLLFKALKKIRNGEEPEHSSNLKSVPYVALYDNMELYERYIMLYYRYLRKYMHDHAISVDIPLEAKTKIELPDITSNAKKDIPNGRDIASYGDDGCPEEISVSGSVLYTTDSSV